VVDDRSNRLLNGEQRDRRQARHRRGVSLLHSLRGSSAPTRADHREIVDEQHFAGDAGLETLRRAWEHLRLDPATGMSVWFRVHVEPVLVVVAEVLAQVLDERSARGDRRRGGVRPELDGGGGGRRGVADGVPGADLEVGGELDLWTAPALCTQIEQACGERILIDLSPLQGCDSIGLRALGGAAREADVRRERLLVVPPARAGAARAIANAGAAEFLPLAGSVESALVQLG
jgi:anti-anti-sigma regulatory factor